MRYAAIAMLIAAGLPSVVFAADAARPAAELVEVRKIWDQGNHNAFTDLIRFRDRWWCCFREGAGHVPARLAACQKGGASQCDAQRLRCRCVA